MYIAIAPHQYSKIMGNSSEVTDLRYRQMIVELIENFRTAYNRRDIPFLKDIFSDETLIITGKVLYPQKRANIPAAFNQTQTQYLSNLQKAFNANAYINIKFDDIAVTRHEVNPNIYGITLKQEWNASGGYHDEGWLFLMIDYEDENNPLIWVRIWQPLIDDNTGKEIHYDPEDILGLGHFPIK